MNRSLLIALAVLLSGLCTLQAQQANPLSANMKGSWTNIRDLLIKMVEKMPEENYRFKATPELQDFGQRMSHAIQMIMRGCTDVKGQPKVLSFSAAPTKVEALAAMKEASAECDSVFNSLRDADATRMVAATRGGMRPEFAVLQGMLEHSQEMYGYMSVYLRLKGIVPPSSDRNDR